MESRAIRLNFNPRGGLPGRGRRGIIATTAAIATTGVAATTTGVTAEVAAATAEVATATAAIISAAAITTATAIVGCGGRSSSWCRSGNHVFETLEGSHFDDFPLGLGSHIHRLTWTEGIRHAELCWGRRLDLRYDFAQTRNGERSFTITDCLADHSAQSIQDGRNLLFAYAGTIRYSIKYLCFGRGIGHLNGPP
jgi:hypothetical protein